MGNAPSTTSSGKRRGKGHEGDSDTDDDNLNAVDVATRAQKVLGENFRELQQGLASGVRKLEEQDHPAAALIDSVCGPYLDTRINSKSREAAESAKSSRRNRDASVRSYYSEDVESEDDSRTLSEDETTTATDYRRDRRRKSAKDEETVDSQSYLSQSDYESTVDGSSVHNRKIRRGRGTSSYETDDDTAGASTVDEAGKLINAKINSVSSGSNPSSMLSKQPLASSFAKRCYFTKQGIGGTTQHYEGLTLTGNVVLMLAAAMKLKGCPTICDEDLRRVEQTYPNQFSRLPDELLLSSGWRRISKYCHFSNKPVPDGVPFFHSKKRLHPSGGYYFLLAAAVGMVRPIDVEPLTRDTLVLLETDYPSQCDSAPRFLIEDPNEWTLVDKFCFFSGGPINTDEDVYYQADFDGNPIFMLAFLSPSLTPSELYKLDAADDNEPALASVAAVEEVESVYDLTDRDFDDLKLYHLGPCRALPQYILQPQAWMKILPPHFLAAKDEALRRAQQYEIRHGMSSVPQEMGLPGAPQLSMSQQQHFAPGYQHPLPHPSDHQPSPYYGPHQPVSSYGHHSPQHMMPPPPPQQMNYDHQVRRHYEQPPMQHDPNQQQPFIDQQMHHQHLANYQQHGPLGPPPPQSHHFDQQYNPAHQQVHGPPHFEPVYNNQQQEMTQHVVGNDAEHDLQRDVEEDGAFIDTTAPMDEALATHKNQPVPMIRPPTTKSQVDPPEDQPPSLSKRHPAGPHASALNGTHTGAFGRNNYSQFRGDHSQLSSQQDETYYSPSEKSGEQDDQEQYQPDEDYNAEYDEDYVDDEPQPGHIVDEDQYYDDNTEGIEQVDSGYDMKDPDDGEPLSPEFTASPSHDSHYSIPVSDGDYGSNDMGASVDEDEDEDGAYISPLKTDFQMNPRKSAGLPPTSPQSAISSQLSNSSALRGAQELLRRNRERRLSQKKNADRHLPDNRDEASPGNSPSSQSELESGETWESRSEITSVVSGSSLWTDNENNPDRSSRRALILQMAKARMKSHKDTAKGLNPTRSKTEAFSPSSMSEGSVSVLNEFEEEKKLDHRDHAPDLDLTGDLD